MQPTSYAFKDNAHEALRDKPLQQALGLFPPPKPQADSRRYG